MPTRRIIESWLQSITPYSYTPEELTERLMHLGIEVESFEDRTRALAGFVVGQVLTKEQHPNADKLSVTTVTTGGDPVTVVCGAPNVAAGQKIVFAPVGTYIAKADLTIDKRKLRGVMSEGMICSEAELGLSDDHDGIMVLPPDTEVGRPVAELFGDIIYEIEVTPNRADCLSHLGIAREVSALTGKPVTMPEPMVKESNQPTADAASVTIEDAELCPRYIARVIKGVKIGPSPEWLQDRLRKLGLRPRNNVVDITSYVLFECGHPLHAFDYDRLAGNRIVVRAAKGGEKFTTLDSREHELPAGALLICDAEKPVAIAGVMGGENSEIHDDTVNVLLESAYFNPSSIRRTARELNIATDASYRFERGADIENTVYAINRAAQLIQELAGGDALAGTVDVYPQPQEPKRIDLRFARTSAIIGVDIPESEQLRILMQLGFVIEQEEQGIPGGISRLTEKLGIDLPSSGLEALQRIGREVESLQKRGREALESRGIHFPFSGEHRVTVTVPTYRVDIIEEIDLIEEIARLHGYDNIPTDSRASVSFNLDVEPLQKLMDGTRHFFIDSGFTEATGLYMTDPESAETWGKPVVLRNALGRDYSMMRTSLAPGMAKTVALNERHSRPDLRLFEVGKAFRQGRPDQGTIPGIVETEELAVLMSGLAEPIAWDTPSRNSDIHDLRGTMDRYFDRIAIRDVDYRPVDEARWGIGAPALAVFVGGEEVGRVGPLDPSLLERFDIRGTPVLALFNLEAIARRAYTPARYSAPSKYPTVERDISILVDQSTANGAMEETIRASGGELLSGVRLFDLYEGKGMEPGKKSVAYSLSFTSHERTLDDATIEEAMQRIIASLVEQHGAQLRG
jgi:phenylalanyl-tRNA synthetase beta chain